MFIFISYRRADSAFPAHALRYALRLAGHEVFLDTGTIAPGEAFRDVIRDSLHKTDLEMAVALFSNTARPASLRVDRTAKMLGT